MATRSHSSLAVWASSFGDGTSSGCGASKMAIRSLTCQWWLVRSGLSSRLTASTARRPSCRQDSCCQTCNNTLCCMFFDGFLARWAVTHFGQAQAGSPLNCIKLCLLRHCAMRGPAAGDLRGVSSRSMRGVVWVEDFVFYLLTPWHEACGGLNCCCSSAAQCTVAPWPTLRRMTCGSSNCAACFVFP
jgi:hypothetical protein